jgi:hypothetical protein
MQGQRAVEAFVGAGVPAKRPEQAANDLKENLRLRLFANSHRIS